MGAQGFNLPEKNAAFKTCFIPLIYKTENAIIRKIIHYLLCSASKHSAVKLLAAAAKSISIISVFGFQTVENSFALCSRISYSLLILLDAQLTT